MSITFACGHCGKTFTIEDKFGGKKGKCKQCGSVMQIPAAGPAPRRPTSPGDRAISPSRRAPTPIRTPEPKHESSSSRRVSTPAPAPTPDIFGFDDEPRPGPSAVMSLDEDDFEPADDGRPLSRSNNHDEPPKAKKKKRKKKSGEESPAMLIGRIALGLAIGSAGVYASMGMLTQVQKALIPDFHSKGEAEALLKERIALNRDLAALIAKVDDVPAAQAASAEANRKLRAMTVNLRKLRTAKGFQKDAEILNRQYEGQIYQATNQLVQEFFKLAQRPLILNALDITGALGELDAEEKLLPGGMTQPDIPTGPMPGPIRPPAPPPNFNPPQQPGMPNGPNNRNRGGRGRGGVPNFGPGGP